MRRYAELMNDTEADELQEAAADVAYLTSQGESPTEAIAKVASAAKFSQQKTNLLTYAYSNGVAAEKRGSIGGPLQRLADFPLPDPKEIQRLVYGEREDKTASAAPRTLKFGMSVFETDPTTMEPDELRSLFGLDTKTASSDEDKSLGKGFSISHTSVSISLIPKKDQKDSDESLGPKSLQDHFRNKIGTLTPEMSDNLETTLLKMLGIKKAAMIEANAEADDAFVHAKNSLDAFGASLNHRHLQPHFKRAGLLSVNAYYPDIAAMLGSYLDEVNSFLVKDASHGSLDITSRHPWVAEAESLQNELTQVAELTVTANQKSAEYEAVCKLYQNRDKIRKSANWSSFLAGSLTPGFGSTAKDLVMGADMSKEKAAIQREILDELDDKMHDLSLRDIELQSHLNDYDTNDEILSAFGKKKLINEANQLLRTAPKTMRNPALAKALLQQSMSQGRMAPTEYMPVLQINKLDPRKESINQGDEHDS